jgi:hypothetical protein
MGQRRSAYSILLGKSERGYFEDRVIDLRIILKRKGTEVAQWLRFCATNRKVAGSIPADVTGFFL